MNKTAVQSKPAPRPLGLLRLLAALLLPAALAACPAAQPAATLELDPTSKIISAGSPAVTFKATAANTLEAVKWTLSGPGTLSTTTGSSVDYTPPAATAITGPITATLTASLTGVGLNKAATITVNPSLGSMQLSIGGLPNGTNANVTVEGPGGFIQAVTATATLTGLTPGSYTVSASNVSVGAVTFGGTVVGSPATVGAGATAPASVAYAALTGSLTVNVGGLPGGLNGDVLVTGPGGFTQTLTTTQTLTGLNLGNYAITPRSVQQPNTVVNTIFDASSRATTVTANANTSANVSYAARGGSGAVWIANQGTLARYTAGQLTTSSNAEPGGLLNPGAGSGLQGMAFDKNSNLWVIDNANRKLLMFSSAKLSGTGAVTPDVVISDNNGALNVTYALAFAPDGSLVVSNVSASTATRTVTSTIVRYAPGQIAQSGNPAPALILDIQASRVDGARGIAFDAQGDLWVGSTSGDLLRYTAAQINQKGSLVNEAATRVRGPQGLASGLAFDAQGNLWVSRDAGGGKPAQIAKYTPAQLAAGTPGPNPPVPDVTLSGVTGAQMAFDNAGNLWFTGGFGTNSVFRLNANQLTANSSPTPNVVISSPSLNIPFGIAFNAAPAGLPLVK